MIRVWAIKYIYKKSCSRDKSKTRCKGTNTSIPFNSGNQTQQIQQSEFGVNTNSPINNFTQTSGPIKNNMGVKLLTGEFLTKIGLNNSYMSLNF